MSVSLQKANFWKRISAYIFDILITIMLAVGLAAAVSSAVGYDSYSDKLEEKYARYGEIYHIDLDITQEQFDALSQEEKAVYEAADKAFGQDEEVREIYAKMFALSLTITTVGLLGAFMITYFIVPLLFKNGQTLGKKCFGIAVMRTNCVRITHFVLFVRSIIGHFVIETLVPVLLVIMMLFGILGSVGTLTLLLLLCLQIGVMIATQTNSSIHDLLSDTMVVDLVSQQIFDTEDDLIAYKQAEHEREIAALKERGLEPANEPGYQQEIDIK